MGGGTPSSTNVYTPTPPAQPTSAEATQAWADTMPQVYETQMKYAPLEAEQQLGLLQKYGVQYGQASKDVNDALYPETAALQEQMAGQAAEGMQADVPAWMKDQYRSDLNANLGTNAGSPMGADYASRGMLQQQQDYQKYYQNMGLSLAGRQPLAQAASPQTSNYLARNTPDQTQNYMANTYGTYAAAGRPVTTSTGASQSGTSLGILGRWGGGGYT